MTILKRILGCFRCPMHWTGVVRNDKERQVTPWLEAVQWVTDREKNEMYWVFLGQRFDHYVDLEWFAGFLKDLYDDAGGSKGYIEKKFDEQHSGEAKKTRP